MEDDKILQDLWAGLLASASERSDSLSPSFIETLKQLTPSEAKTLENLFGQTGSNPRLGTPDEMRFAVEGNLDDVNFQLMTETFERLGLIRRRYDLHEPRQLWWTLAGLEPSSFAMNWVEFGQKAKNPLPELTYEFEFTEYGVQFMRACKGPKQQDYPQKLNSPVGLLTS